MADTNTPMLDLLLQETGAHDNDWGNLTNDLYGFLENAIKASRANATTGGTTTLTKATAREYLQRVTGVLGSNAIIEVPNIQSRWLFSNETTGNFTVTVKVNGQTGVVIPQGSAMILCGNGTDVVAVQAAQPRGVESKARTMGGTVDALTATFQPPLPGRYPPGATVIWTSPGANTITDPTLNGDGIGTITIKKGANVALAVGDTGPSGYQCEGIVNDDASAIILKNPAKVDATGVTAVVAGKKGIWIDAGALRPKIANGCGFSDFDSGSNDVTLRTADFDTTTQEYAQFKLAMPSIWNEGTISFKAYWTNAGGASTQTVVWSLAAAAFSDDDALNTTFGTAQTVTDTWLAQGDLHISPESSAITVGGSPQAGDLVVFEITRVVGSDNMAGDANLIGIMLYITTDGFNEA